MEANGHPRSSKQQPGRKFNAGAMKQINFATIERRSLGCTELAQGALRCCTPDCARDDVTGTTHHHVVDAVEPAAGFGGRCVLRVGGARRLHHFFCRACNLAATPQTASRFSTGTNSFSTTTTTTIAINIDCYYRATWRHPSKVLPQTPSPLDLLEVASNSGRSRRPSQTHWYYYYRY